MPVAESRAVHASEELRDEQQRAQMLQLLVSATKKLNEPQHTVPFTKPDETKRATQAKNEEPQLIMIQKDSEVASGTPRKAPYRAPRLGLRVASTQVLQGPRRHRFHSSAT